MERRRTDRRMKVRRTRDLGVPIRPRRRPLVLLVLLVLVAAPLAWGALRRSALVPGAEIPAELIGTWETSAPNYADRALEFTKTSVILHSDAYHFTVHHVLAVRRTPREMYVQYHVEYEDRDAPTPLDFRYIASPHPVLRLEHIATVWRRTSPL
jgi:hypothetical protein